MAISEAQKRASLKWDRENMVVLSCKIKKEHADKFKAYCAAHDMTSNTALKGYVMGCIDAPPVGDGGILGAGE